MIQVRLRAVDNHVPTVSIPIHKDAMKNQKPRFFCENCNAEVKRDAKFCSKCGHFFASVRCPVCGKTGIMTITVLLIVIVSLILYL